MKMRYQTGGLDANKHSGNVDSRTSNRGMQVCLLSGMTADEWGDGGDVHGQEGGFTALAGDVWACRSHVYCTTIHFAGTSGMASNQSLRG